MKTTFIYIYILKKLGVNLVRPNGMHKILYLKKKINNSGFFSMKYSNLQTRSSLVKKGIDLQTSGLKFKSSHVSCNFDYSLYFFYKKNSYSNLELTSLFFLFFFCLF